MKVVNIAHATSNGIIFFSNQCPELGTLAYFDDSGEIKTRQVFTKIQDIEDFIIAPPKFVTICDKRFVILFDLILILVCAIVSFFTLNFNLLLAALYFSVTVSSEFFYLINNVLNLKFVTHNNFSRARLHSAEHMVLNAYVTLQKVPTLDEIKTFSRFSKKCGSRFVLSKVTLYTLLSIFMALAPYMNPFLYLALILLLIILYIVDSKTGILCFLQVLVTNKPTDKELLLAIEGIKQHEITENEIIENEKKLINKITDEYSSMFEGIAELTILCEEVQND